MNQPKRSRFFSTQKMGMWCRWKAGQSLHEIGRAYGKHHTFIRGVLLPRGAIPPIARSRLQLALTLAEREDISRGIASGWTLHEVARELPRLGRNLSTENPGYVRTQSPLVLAW